MTPNPDFEHFVRDYLRQAGQEKSRELRTRLLSLARDWMHAAMQDRPEVRTRRSSGAVRIADLDGRDEAVLLQPGFSLSCKARH